MTVTIRQLHPQVTILSSFWDMDEATVALNPAAPPLQPVRYAQPTAKARIVMMRDAAAIARNFPS